MMKLDFRPAMAVCVLFLCQHASAAEWSKELYLGLREIYSDNIGYSGTDGEEDYVTEIRPGILLIAEGKRTSFDLNYELQDLTYARESGRNTSNHHLDSSLSSELLQDRFYLEMTGKVSEHLSDIRDGVSPDLVSGSANLQEVSSFSITPRWRERLGSIAEFDMSYNHSVAESENDALDSDGERFSAQLVNGDGSGFLWWQGTYQKSRIEYEDNNLSDIEFGRATLGFRFSSQFSLDVSGAYENNEFVGSRGSNQPDDEYYGVGFTWSPSQRFRLSSSYNERPDPDEGEDKNFGTGSLEWKPSSRTSFSAEIGNRFFGETYRFQLAYKRRNSSISISYNENISEFRGEALTEESIGSLICPVAYTSLFQCRIFDPNEPPQAGERVVGVNRLLPSITANTYILENLNASYSIFGRRNSITLGVSNQVREYLADGQEQEDISFRLSWTYQLGARTTSSLSLRRVNRTYEDDVEDDYNYVNWLVSREVGRNLQASIEFSYADRESQREREFEENRVVLSLLKYF